MCCYIYRYLDVYVRVEVHVDRALIHLGQHQNDRLADRYQVVIPKRDEGCYDLLVTLLI